VFRRAREASERQERDALVEFLSARAEAIAREAAENAIRLLPVGGRAARKLLRSRYERQLRELARLLNAYGAEEGPHLYGELQRPAAKGRLDEGLALHEAIEEARIVFEASVDIWSRDLGPLPPAVSSTLAAAFAETAGQTAEVWLAHFHAEGARFQEAALLETIVHHLDEAILVFEADGTVSYATPAIERVAGLRPAGFVGSGPEAFQALLRTLSPVDRDGRPLDPDRLPYAEALRTRAPASVEAVGVTRPGGTPAVLEVTAAPVFDEDGEFRGVIVTVRDRTERVRHLRELEEANERLKSMYARMLSRSRLEAVGVGTQHAG
jgi:PAS domain-containing protein